MNRVCKLKNGTEEVSALVAITMLTIRGIWNNLSQGGPIAFYELVQICKDNDHEPFGDMGELLCKSGLVTRFAAGTFEVSTSIKNIVLSAAEGEGFDIQLVDPVDRS